MLYRNILFLFLFAATLSYSSSYLLTETYAQSSIGCINGNTGTNNSTLMEEGGGSSLISPGGINMENDFSNWRVISGNWNQSSSFLEGGAAGNTTSLAENIIINPKVLENISEITTTFKIGDIDNNLSSYAYIIYSFVDPDNYKMAGIHIFKDDIFVRFVEIVNGCLIAEPNYIYTGIKWQPGITLKLDISSDDAIQGLRLNDTQFAGNSDPNIDGITGLYYGRSNDIDFYNFSVQAGNVANQSSHLEQLTITPNQNTELNLN